MTDLREPSTKSDWRDLSKKWQELCRDAIEQSKKNLALATAANAEIDHLTAEIARLRAERDAIQAAYERLIASHNLREEEIASLETGLTPDQVTYLHELADSRRAAWNIHALRAERDALRERLTKLVDAEALAGIRAQVAGWDGEGREDGPYKRHHAELGASLPKTNCGAVYALDEAIETARKLLSAGKQT